MAIYIIILIIFPLIYLFFKYYPIKGKNELLFCLIYFFILFVISAFRSETVGGDLENYLPEFDAVSKMNFKQLFVDGYFGREKGFLVIEKIISVISSSHQAYIFFTSLIFCSISYYVIIKYSANVYLSIFLFITISYLFSFNIIRAAIAGSICLLSYNAIITRKFIKFLLIIVSASLIHITAIFALPLYFLWNLDYKPYRVIFFIIVSLIISYIISGSIAVSYMIELLPYFAIYENSSYVSDFSSGLTTLSYAMIIFTLLEMYLYKISSGKDKISELFIWITASATSIQFFASLFVLINRISSIYYAFIIISLPYLLKRYNGKYKSLFLFFIALYFILLYIIILTQDQQAIIPYSFTF